MLHAAQKNCLALKECDEDMYPNLYVLLKICCTIPATSCECERSASALRRLHTFNRASMTQERLSSLALMHIHYLTDIDLDIVLDLFAKMHPRRLELGTLLKDRDDQQPAEWTIRIYNFISIFVIFK